MGLERTEVLDNLYTTTWYARLAEVVEQIFTATPLWLSLSQRGNLRTQSGGRQIEIPVNYGKNTTVKGIGRGGSVDMVDVEHLTTLAYDWKWIVANMIRYFVDEQKNKGKAAILNKVNSDIDNTRNSIIDKLETDAFGDGTGDGGLTIHGLSQLVSTAPTSGIIGGVNRTTYSWFRNKYKNMTGEDPSVFIVKRMETMFNDCGKLAHEGKSRFPDLIVTDQTTYEGYKTECLGIYQITSNKGIADLGFGDLAYRGQPLTWSTECTAGYMYFLNSRFLYWIADTEVNFMLTGWKEIPLQLDRVAQSVTQGNIITSCPASNGVIFNITWS